MVFHSDSNCWYDSFIVSWEPESLSEDKIQDIMFIESLQACGRRVFSTLISFVVITFSCFSPKAPNNRDIRTTRDARAPILKR